MQDFDVEGIPEVTSGEIDMMEKIAAEIENMPTAPGVVPTLRHHVSNDAPVAPMIPVTSPLPPPLPPQSPPPELSSEYGLFVRSIATPANAVERRHVVFTMDHVYRSFRAGRPLEMCEMLYRDAIPSRFIDFGGRPSVVKPFFDFDHTVDVTTLQNDSGFIQDSVIASFVIDWRSEVHSMIQAVLPTITLDQVKVSHRHRVTDPNSGTYKISGRFFVKGVRTTLSDLSNLAKIHMASHPTSRMDTSVYSASRKMSMVFCVKNSSSAADNVALLPGVNRRDAENIMKCTSGFFDIKDYCIQYTSPDDVVLKVAPPPLPNRRAPMVRAPLRELHPATLEPLHCDEHLPPEEATSTKFMACVPLLEMMGFTNPRQDGHVPPSNGNTVVINFRADNVADCPVCGGEHTSNRWFVVLGDHFMVSNHSQNCRPIACDHDITTLRPMPGLMRSLITFGPVRHWDYASAFADYVDDVLSYDADEETFYIFSQCIKWKPVADIHIQKDMQKYLSSVVQQETIAIKAMRDMLAGLKCEKSVQNMDKQLGLLASANTSIGKNDFQRSCLAQLKMIVSQPESLPFDSHQELIHFDDGVLNLDTGEFRPTKASDYNKFTTGYKWEQSEWSEALPNVTKVMETILPYPEIRRLFHMFAGLCMSGRTDCKKIFALCDMLHGHNGKSFVMQLLSKMLGDYSAKPPRNAITLSRANNAESASPFLMSLKGKRFFLVEELGDRPLDTSLLKEFTTGLNGTRIAGRQLYGKPTSFAIMFKIAMTANKGRLNFSTTDEAFKKRLVTIPFQVTFVSNPNLVKPPEYMLEDSAGCEKMLCDPATHCAFARWAYEGYKDWVAHREMLDDENFPRAVQGFKNQIVLYNDPAMELIHDTIVFTDNPNDYVVADEVWRTCRQNPRLTRHTKEKDFMATLKMFVQSVHPDSWSERVSRATGDASVTIKKYKYRYVSAV